jgi:cell division protein FtsX
MLFLTLLVGLSSHLSDVSSWLTDKLWMYFYINSDIDPQLSNTKVLTLLKELEQDNVKAQYISQDQAQAFLAKRLPHIVKKFQEYNINNTLPATLFVTIQSDANYASLQKIMPRYADIIQNVNEVATDSTIKWQEQRVIKALDFSYFLRGASIVLIAIFALVMMGVVLLVLLLKLRQFSDIITLKKLLGADYSQIRKPFLLFVGSLLLWWYVLSFVIATLIGIGSLWADQSLIYFSQLLGVEGMKTGVRWLIFGGYWMVMILVWLITAGIMFASSFVVEHRIRTAQ